MATNNNEEDRLAHALVTRGWITREEAKQCRANPPGKAQAFLQRLVQKSALTLSQAKRLVKEMDQLIGQSIPGYQMMEKLGQGAMGVVFKARQISMNRFVAIKILNQRLASKPEYIERFQQEARFAAKLSHNNVVQAIDVGSAGHLHYFVMELVEGPTLRDELERDRIFEEKEAIEIILQVAQALSHAHRRGLIHRDIKPGNIILTPEGIVKLADLGLARETTDKEAAKKERGLTMGTPFYLSPEQIFGDEHIDGRADLYALGATLYHIVTGQAPFPYSGVEDVLDAHLQEDLTPPDALNEELSSGFSEVVEYLMEKKRGRRYPSADDLIVDLECLLNDEPPRLARQKLEAGMLRDLAEGEEVDEEGRAITDESNPSWTWVIVLASILGVSVILNLVLLLK